MLIIQHQLNDLVKRRAPVAHQSEEPLSFSICTQGPIMELWVHYTTSMQDSTQDARFYNMHLLQICHASCPNTVREFFMAVEGVMIWASSELLNDVAKQLYLVWKAAPSGGYVAQALQKHTYVVTFSPKNSIPFFFFLNTFSTFRIFKKRALIRETQCSVCSRRGS